MSNKHKYKTIHRKMRHKRVRAKINGTSEVPRISVFKSNKNLFVQFIDDSSQKTLLSNSIKKIKNKKMDKKDIATEIGELLAKDAKKAGVNRALLDKGGYKYHGRVKALADGLRRGGIKI
jgi:large subunit ribosomal protein L18